jgi:hypothetical protein
MGNLLWGKRTLERMTGQLPKIGAVKSAGIAKDRMLGIGEKKAERWHARLVVFG